MTGSGGGVADVQLTETDGGIVIRLGRRSLTHPVRPVEAARQRAASISTEPHTLYILASPLLHYGLDVFLDRLPESSCVIGVEQDERLLRLTEKHAARSPGGIPVLLSRDPATTANKIARDHMNSTIRRCRLVSFCSGLSIASEHYRAIEELVTQQIANRVRNIATLIHFGRKWCRHIFRSIAHSPVPLPDIPVFGSDAVVVAAAGESLEAAAPVLREHRSSFRLVAVDTALGPLAACGLLPDMVIAVESQVINTGHFLTTTGQESVLIHDLTCHPDAIRLWPENRRFTVATRFAELRLFDRIASYVEDGMQLPGLGSVGVTACEIAARLTGGPIVLAGFDFSYVPGKPHAKHALSTTLSLIRSGRLTPDILYELAMSRPLVHRRTSDVRSYTSDSVLLSYVPQLTQVLPSTRTHTFPRTGPDIGIPDSGLDAIRDVFRTQLPVEGTALSRVSGVHQLRGGGQYWQSKARSFIAHEQYLLEHAQRSTKSLDELTDLDYAWVDFPDAHESGFLSSERGRVRVRSRIESYVQYLNHIANTCVAREPS